MFLACGCGSCLGGAVPKQFLVVNGKSIIEHTLDRFEFHPLISEIVIVCKSDCMDQMREIVRAAGYKKVAHILAGGKERYHSSLAAIAAYEDEECNLLIHDGVRPNVSDRIISDCVKALEHFEAVDVAIETTDTIIELDEQGNIARIPQRRLLRNAQTPQCFRRSLIAEAFKRALQDPDFFPTDDTSVVHKYMPDTDIKVVPGEVDNIKVTYLEDLKKVNL